MRDGSKSLAHERPQAEDERPSAEILQFRPRQRLGDRAVAGAAAPDEPDLPDDLAQYEQDSEEEDLNYPHRMLMNVIAVVVVTLLIGLGVWLADTIAKMERDQDCVLQGRQNCAPIEIATPLRK
jgi:hypothetical protein